MRYLTASFKEWLWKEYERQNEQPTILNPDFDPMRFDPLLKQLGERFDEYSLEEFPKVEPSSSPLLRKFLCKVIQFISEEREQYILFCRKKDQQIQNLEKAHAEFLDTQLDFYKLAKPILWQEFTDSNPSSLDVGNLLNFLEAKLKAKDKESLELKQNTKQFLTNQIQLIKGVIENYGR